MLSRALAATPWGIDARSVEVEVDQRKGLPDFHLVGLADAAVKESKDRVRSAVRNSGFGLRTKATVVNLAPADLRKEGNHLDLAIALGLLTAHRMLPADILDGRMMCGELGLDGTLRPVRGALAIASLARDLGVRELLLPAECAGQAAALRDIAVIPVRTLSDAIGHLVGTCRLEPCEPIPWVDRSRRRVGATNGSFRTMNAGSGFDLADVVGQGLAKRALEVAAAGTHNLLFVGPPGSGKTLLAQTLPNILPPLTEEEALVATKVHSLSAARCPAGLLDERPFRAPHHSISTAGLIGGGSVPRPGEVSLAHAGVLFLDELPEFRKDALETLRQPLESGVVDIVRAKARFRFPASFQLLAAMNPCRCGYSGDPRHDCRCAPGDIARYVGRISGPLLDRIDLQVTVPAVPLRELRQVAKAEPSREVLQRVLAAREIRGGREAESRKGASGSTETATTTVADLMDDPQLTTVGRRTIERAYDRFKLSARAVTRILRVARTVADLEGCDTIERNHVAEAVQYRVGVAEEMALH